MARAVVLLNFNALLEKAKLKDDGSNYMVSWYSHGGVARRQMPQGLSVRVRLLLIGLGAGMRVVRASLPRFGALRRDNTPTPACLSVSGISGTELLLELYLSSVP